MKFGYKKAPGCAEAGLFGFAGLFLLHHRLPAAIVFVHNRIVLFPGEALLVWIFSGLSPLARGTHLRLQRGLQSRRFIPAGAGNTFRRLVFLAELTVYPRWRGEHYS